MTTTTAKRDLAQIAAELADFSQYPPEENCRDGQCIACGYPVRAHQALIALGHDERSTFAAHLHRGCAAEVQHEQERQRHARTEARFVECDARTLAAQIGPRTILAISGGRIYVRETGVTLPVSNGYRVTVDLAGNDTYTVRRVFTRAGKTWIKGERSDVYCEQVGEVAYQASCFRNVKL
jgi:hypothetical protein